MANVNENKSLNQQIKTVGNALLLIIPVTFRWVEVMIKSVGQPPARKLRCSGT